MHILLIKMSSALRWMPYKFNIILMFEDRIIQRIIDTWSLDQAHPLSERIQIPLPPFDQIKKIVETAYLASLEREEGRPVRFALVAADPDVGEKISAMKRPPGYLLHLQTPLPLSVASIIKLAPALDPEISAMAVGLTEDKDDMHIWGIFTFSSISSSFAEIPMWVYGELAFRPDFFTVYANNAGSLLIARHHSQIGRILNGEFIPATPSPFTLKSLGRYLMGCIQDHALYKTHGDAYWRIYRDTIELLLAEASARGHGSIFILVNPGDYPAEYIAPRFSFNEKISPQYLLEQLLRNDLDVPTSIAARKSVVDRIKFLAQLGTVDGAVILSTELDLVCFGATLSAPPWTGIILTGPDGFGEGGGEILDPSRLGTRHNAAIAFAGAVKDSLAFVISQDGPARAFVLENENTLLFWPDCYNISMYF